MKLKFKLTTLLVAASLLIANSVNANEALPMSPQEITELQQLFPNNRNVVPDSITAKIRAEHQH